MSKAAANKQNGNNGNSSTRLLNPKEASNHAFW